MGVFRALGHLECIGVLVKTARLPIPGGKTVEVQDLCKNLSRTFYNLRGGQLVWHTPGWASCLQSRLPGPPGSALG